MQGVSTRRVDDVLDAMVLALFAETVRPQLRPLPDAEQRALEAPIARRTQLVEMSWGR